MHSQGLCKTSRVYDQSCGPEMETLFLSQLIKMNENGETENPLVGSDSHAFV